LWRLARTGRNSHLPGRALDAAEVAGPPTEANANDVERPRQLSLLRPLTISLYGDYLAIMIFLTCTSPADSSRTK
jgi:hypothetical protein